LIKNKNLRKKITKMKIKMHYQLGLKGEIENKKSQE
jgi:hypothetical protein